MSIIDDAPDIDVRLLVRWLGADGTRAGLKESKKCTVAVLVSIAKQLKIETPSKPTRKQLIEDIVKVANKRIDLPTEKLLEMGRDELVQYFERVDVDRQELLDLLKTFKLDPGREGRRNLLKFVAAELSETGRFQRIASNEKSGS